MNSVKTSRESFVNIYEYYLFTLIYDKVILPVTTTISFQTHLLYHFSKFFNPSINK